MDAFNTFFGAINDFIWQNTVLYVVLATGVIFTVWSVFGQYRSLTHGVAVTRGKYDDKDDPGAINHFQALSAALSATVGLGNIGGVAIAISLGGPGAVFWMWVVGFLGMAVKLTEVTLSMLYRNTDDPDNPHGGPMWVVQKSFAEINPKLKGVGTFIGGLFCVTLLVSAITGGNMFQSWNVAEITHQYFGIPTIFTGTILAMLVGMVIIGGIKRIGNVAGTLVPFMCGAYLIAGITVFIVNIEQIPAAFGLIFRSAFNPLEATDAFIGGSAGYAFFWGMKRALFSNEAGQGSSPIAHSAAKTSEPVREGIVAGLEPFIDTIVVCTITAMVILTSGVWKRSAEAEFAAAPQVISVPAGGWVLEDVPLPERQGADWADGHSIYVVLEGEANESSGNNLHKLEGIVAELEDGGFIVEWQVHDSETQPTLRDNRIFVAYLGAALTGRAFDVFQPGLGKWLVTMAAWLFAVSTMISWNYYGEQGIVYLFGQRGVTPYRLIYIILIVVATLGFMRTDAQLDALTSLGTGVMLWVNIPITLFFGYKAMRAYHNYIGRLKAGKFHPHATPKIADVVSGHDVE
ncbi:MAG: sodium:alanine symporter family protein [Gammaproteobacteria bacterium]|nr:MAG: sodium:alanine symporter family protein [Gammaproteobacteria bacterium]